MNVQKIIFYLPILTTIFAFTFTFSLYHHWKKKKANYLFWWALGTFTYGFGTLMESFTTFLGWQDPLFRLWYISGALLGGAPLAQGTVYLLFSKRKADFLAFLLVSVISIAAICVLLTPLNPPFGESIKLSGQVMEWQWIRRFSPFINGYAFLFLVGGAIWSAYQYARYKSSYPSRVWGNLSIAFGALLPGVGGASARYGYLEVLYITELAGILIIWLGYRLMVRDEATSIHIPQHNNTP